MNKTIFGAIFAAVLVSTLGMTVAYAAHTPDGTAIEDFDSDGETVTMTVDSKIKQIPANKAEGLITFWAWQLETEGDEAARVLAITIHHGANDHQVFDDGADNNPTNKNIKSSPVQSFHPHIIKFDANNCVVGLESPKIPFKVQHDTLTAEFDEDVIGAATGTADPGQALCGGSPLGIGISHVFDNQLS